MDADLADIHLISKYNKEFHCILYAFNIYIKYGWVVPFKDKKTITITNAFQNKLNESNHKSEKHGYIKESNFTIDQSNHTYKIMI